MQRFQILVEQISHKMHANVANLNCFPALSRFHRIQNRRERSVAVDREIHGPRPSSPARRGREQGERKRARGGTCRRRGAPGRLGGEGGWPGQLLGGGGVAGDAPPRRHGAVAEQLGVELRLLLCCTWVKGGVVVVVWWSVEARGGHL